MSCSTTYKTINSVRAIPFSDIIWNTPFNALKAQGRYVSFSDSATLTDTQKAKLDCYTAGTKGIELLFDHNETDIDVSSKRNRAGELFTVTFKFTITDPSEDDATTIDNQLSALRKAHHLLITYYGGARAIIRVCDPTVGYQFNLKDSASKIEAEISIANLTGIQRLK